MLASSYNLVEDESEDDDELGIEYGYSRGRKVILLQNKSSRPLSLSLSLSLYI
jgi:hypothetical protein